MALRIGKRCNVACRNLCLSGQELPYVKEIKYLGVYIKSGLNLKCSYIHCKLRFYRCFNAVYCKAKAAASELICVNLLKTYCLPLILYATEAICPANRDIQMLEKLIDTAVGKIFNTFDGSLISDIRSNVGLDKVSDIIEKRHAKFYKKFCLKEYCFSSTIRIVNCDLLDIL